MSTNRDKHGLYGVTCSLCIAYSINRKVKIGATAAEDSNKVAFDMMELPLPMKGTSCFHGLKARNFKNAGNMIVSCR